MNRLSFFLLFISCIIVIQAQNVKTSVKSFNFVGPFAVNMPYKVDSVNPQNKTLDEKSVFLESFSNALLTRAKVWSGSVLPSLPHSKSISMLSFYIDSDRYQTGNITVKGPKDYQLYVDGKESSGSGLKLAPYRHEVIIRYLTAAASHDSINVTISSNTVVPITLSKERRYTVHDCLEGLRIRSASISPSGKYMIVGYSNVEANGHSQYYVHVKEASTGKIIDIKAASDNLQWMPHSDAYLYETRSDGKRMLYKVDPTTGHTTLLASDLPEGYFTISPREDYLILSAKENGPKEKPEIFEVIQPEDRQPGWRNRTYLMKYDLSTGIAQRLTYGSHSTDLSDITNDGRYILFTVSHYCLTKRPTIVTDVIRMDVSTMKVDTLLNREEFLYDFHFSPDGKKLLVRGSADAFKGIGLKIKPKQIANMFDNQLFMYDIATRKATALTKDFDPSIGDVTYSPYDRQIYFTASDKDYVRLYTMNPDNGKIRPIETKEDVVSLYNIACHSPYILYIGQSVSNSVRMYLLNLKNKKTVCQEDCSKTILRDVVLGECKDWNFLSSRGDTIYGRFYLPPHFDATKKYPLIVNYYGGCSPTDRTFESRYPAHAYAAQGYVVYVVQPSGAFGFGQEFSARHVNAWGKMTADDIIEGTKKFCEEHPFINVKKIGCIGASYGGFMTQYLQTVTDIFAAAISHAGISNITSYWGEGYWGYSYSEAASAGNYPWNAPDMYTRQSPLFNADKIHTPILFLHGTADTNVPIGESIQMFTALKLLGRQTAFVEVAEENHHILDYNKRLLWTDTIFAWFDKWLKDDASWWNSLYPPKDL